MVVKKQVRTTSKQVAERAGVSQTTVSFVLNNVGDANISVETRERVLQAARDLNYVPNMAAKAMARGRSNNIALVVIQPHRQILIDEYIPYILSGMTLETQKRGFRIMVELVEGGRRDNVFDNLLQSNEAAGLIVNFNYTTPHDESKDVEEVLSCVRRGLPIVSLANVHPEIPSVEVDKFDGVYKIVNHLLSLGHERIACISYAPQGNLHADHRLEIFRTILHDAGLPVDEALIRNGEFDPETGYQAMKSILQSTPHPTALYAMNDTMAFGAIAAIREFGLRVPEDIAVVGFDDIRLARFSTPPLTTIYEPDIDHGRLAAEMLLALINGETPQEKHITLETQLIVRRSCGAYLHQK